MRARYLDPGSFEHLEALSEAAEVVLEGGSYAEAIDAVLNVVEVAELLEAVAAVERERGRTAA